MALFLHAKIHWQARQMSNIAAKLIQSSRIATDDTHPEGSGIQSYQQGQLGLELVLQEHQGSAEMTEEQTFKVPFCMLT